MTLPSMTYKNNYRTINGVVSISSTDEVLYVDTTSQSCSITLQGIPDNFWSTTYKLYVIDVANNASNNNIVINAGSGQTINGASTYTINTNGGYVLIQIAGNGKYIVTSTSTGGAGTPFSGTNWSFVYGNTTHALNASQLQSAYNSAKLATPNGSPLSANNRFTIYVGAGYYTFSSTFTLDTQFIDIVSLSGNTDVIFNGASTISITANDVYVKGISVTTKNFTIANNLANLVLENCEGGDNSFGGSVTVSGTFINCTGGDNSFGGVGVASGVFTNCTGGSNSFGGLGGTASGTFTNCTGGQYAFAGGGGTASGTFTNCTSFNYSFGGGGGGVASGTFYNCTAILESFGGGSGGVASGTFYNCVGGEGAFGGNEGTASGTFTNCTGGDESFGGSGAGVASGTFNHCVGGDGAFGNSVFGISAPTFNHCVAGTNSFGDSAFSGKASYCIGSTGSFAASGTLRGQLYWCQLKAGTFAVVGAGGRTIYCIDGSNNTNNQ